MPTDLQPFQPRLVLGVDGGGTNTRAAIVDLNGQLVGVGQAGPSNYDDLGVAAAQNNLSEAIQLARRQAGLGDAPFASAFFGMAGVVTRHDRSIIRQMVSNLAVVEAGRAGVDHDCRIALAGGLAGRPGIALITGTGSSCYGRNAQGRDWLSGGWGSLISDEGSGYWFGVQALRIAAMVDDKRAAPSPLYAAVRAYLGLGEMRELMHRMYVQGFSRSEIAAMAPMVIEAARQGDPAALGLLEQGAQDLAVCVAAAARQVGLSTGVCEIAQAGGMLNAGEIYQRRLQTAILAQLPQARFSLPELPPVLGACLLALQGLGVAPDEGIIQALKQAQL